MEKELTDIFKQLKDLEDMDLKIKRDLKHLEAIKLMARFSFASDILNS